MFWLNEHFNFIILSHKTPTLILKCKINVPVSMYVCVFEYVNAMYKVLGLTV